MLNSEDVESKSQILNSRVRCFFYFVVLFSFPYPEVVCVFSSSGLFLGVPNTI